MLDYCLKNNLYGIYHLSSTDYMNRVQILQTILKFTNYDFNIIGLETKKDGPDCQEAS